jgi:hypothetical protein
LLFLQSISQRDSTHGASIDCIRTVCFHSSFSYSSYIDMDQPSLHLAKILTSLILIDFHFISSIRRVGGREMGREAEKEEEMVEGIREAEGA